jgi:hypothetical protein
MRSASSAPLSARGCNADQPAGVAPSQWTNSGGDYFTNRDPERQTKRLIAQLERLGHHVTLTQGAAAA